MSQPHRPRRTSQLSPIGGSGFGGGSGWSSFSNRRKRRLIRTGAIGLVLLILFIWVLSKCGSDETVAVPNVASTTTVSSTEVPRAQLATATALQVQLGGATYAGVPAVIDSKIYVLGGLNDKKQSSKTVWLFDPLTNTVTEAGALTAPTHDPMGGAIGQTAFAFGGGAGNKTFDKVEVFAAGATVATVSSKLPTPRTDGIAVSTPTRDSLFVIGGYDGKNPTNDVLGTSDGKTFVARAVLPQPVRYPAAEISGNVIWVFGGEQNNQPTDLIQKIDLTTNEATVAGHLAAPMSRVGVHPWRDHLHRRRQVRRRSDRCHPTIRPRDRFHRGRRGPPGQDDRCHGRGVRRDGLPARRPDAETICDDRRHHRQVETTK